MADLEATFGSGMSAARTLVTREGAAVSKSDAISAASAHFFKAFINILPHFYQLIFIYALYYNKTLRLTRKIIRRYIEPLYDIAERLLLL